MNVAEPLPLPVLVRIEPVGPGDLGVRVSPSGGRPVPGRAPALIPYSAFCRALARFPALAELRLEGPGEPLLHPRLFDMVRFAADRGIAVSLKSGLQTLSAARAQECVLSGLARLRVPIDPAQPDPRVERNLERIVQARAEYGLDAPRIERLAAPDTSWDSLQVARVDYRGVLAG